MKLRIGPPVTGGGVYPRPHLIDTITRALDGGHVAFLGPRRTGKSSCLKAIVAHPPSGYLPLLLNLESQHCLTDWFKEMAAVARAALNQPTDKAGWLKEKGA